jgi:CNT family concentrative nucleoside transporter
MDPHRLLGFASIAIIVGIMYLWSDDRKSISWRFVAYALISIFVFQLLCLKVPGTSDGLFFLSGAVSKLSDLALKGEEFVLGPTITYGLFFKPGQEVQQGEFIFAMRIFPTIVLICSLCEVLYWCKVLPVAVKGIGFLLRRLGLGGAEATALAATPIMGQIESALLVKPYVPMLTPSELFTYMVGSMASTAGGALVLYMSIGLRPQWLITASFSHLLAGVLLSKMKRPETNRDKLVKGDVELAPTETHGFFGAMIGGAYTGAAIGGSVLLLVGLVIAYMSIADAAFSAIAGHWTDHPLTYFLGQGLRPVAFMFGIDWNEALTSGQIISKGAIFNEVVAMLDYIKAVRDGQLSEHTQCILTFAITLFAHPCSIGIQIGGLSAMAPERKAEINANAWRAMIVATLAAWLSASVVSIIV